MLCLCAEASAQKMITFESRTVSNGKYKKRGRNHEHDGNNSLTLGLASTINGFVPVYYERKLTPMLTVQVGAGITFRSFLNDVGQMFYTDIFGVDNTEYFTGSEREEIIDRYENYEYRKAKLGQYLSVSPKLYFSSGALNGAYVAPMIEYKRYNYEAHLVDETKKTYNLYDDEDQPRIGQTMNEHMTCLDFTINFGGHIQTKSHVALGFNVGVGARSISAERLDIGMVRNDAGDWHLANVARKYTATRPLMVFNFILGGWF